MQETDTSLRTSKYLAFLLFFVISALVIMMGFLFYQHQRHNALDATKENLQTAQDLYARQISYWRGQHITRAHILASDSRFRVAAATLALDEQNTQAREQLRTILGALQSNYEYHALYLTDATGRPLVLSTSASGDEVPGFKCPDLCLDDIDMSLELNQAVFSSIYLPVAARDNPEYKHLHMNLILPLELEHEGERVRVILVVIIDPETFLVPLLDSWPVPHKTAEAVLVRRYKDKIIRLTETRFLSQPPLSKVSPPARSGYVGQFIQSGQEGFFAGQDYRQAEVLAQIETIPGTPWILVVKMDEAEVMAPLRATALYAAGVAACVVGLTGLLTLMWWRQHAYRYRNLILRRDRENDALLQRLDNLSRYANDIILLCDHRGGIVDANERALDTYGYSLIDLRNMNIRQLCDVENNEWDAMLIQLDSGEGVKFECFNYCADGEEIPVEISAGWIETDDQRMLQAIIRDISERKEAEELLRRQAHYDDLTGLPNRSLATENLGKAIQRAQRNQSQVALLFIDLDMFKHINDTLGHVVGDQVLVLFARRIEKVLGENARVSRFGEDEFLIQIENIKTTLDIITLVDKVVESIGEPVTIEGFEISATVSIGISIAPNDSREVNQLIRYADMAMYRAKERGRNGYQFFTPDMHQRAEQRLGLEGALRRAVQRKELILHYQPQVDMRNGAVTGCEALVRWRHPEQGLIPPFEFIGLAEEIGLIHEIGAWVVDEACRQIGAWQNAGHPELKIAINVSPHQLQNKNLARDILRTVARHELEPGTLEVEITETALMRDTALAIAQMRDLSNGGVSLAIDDFGTGYSSLGHLHRFPLNKLKIDRSFVSNIDAPQTQDGGTIPRAIISLAHELGLDVIAEGIETQSQRDFLIHAECVAGQGYLFSKPLPAREFGAILGTNLGGE